MTSFRQDNDKVLVWQPIKGSSQELILSAPVDVLLICGDRGGGKSDCQLMDFRKHVGKGYGSYWKGIIFDREYKNLDDLVSKAKRWFPKFFDGAKWLGSKDTYKWVWQTGEELLFRTMASIDDYWNYHGHEYPWIGWNELTKYPTSELFDMLFSCNRSSFVPEEHSPDLEHPLPPIPLRTVATTNPFGAGHLWVKQMFIDAGHYGEIVRLEIMAFNPKTKREEVFTRTQTTVFCSHRENTYLSHSYIAALHAAIKDANMRKAWLYGDWDIDAGGVLSDVWKSHTHIIERFPIPSNWRVYRAMDWGSSRPFSIGWFAECDGTEVELPDGTVFCPPNGSYIQIFEWYGTSKLGSNKGVRYSSRTVAQGIRTIEDALAGNGWINSPVYAGAADNSIASTDDIGVPSVKEIMEEEGVYWERSDKSKGSRVRRLQVLRDMLEAASTGEGKAVYFMRNCKVSTTLIPILPADPKEPDAADTEAEDHAYDMVTYQLTMPVNNQFTVGTNL